MVIQPCVCIAASHVGLAGLPVLAVYSSATFCISATLFCFSFTDILSKISFLNFCGAKVQLFLTYASILRKIYLYLLLLNDFTQQSVVFESNNYPRIYSRGVISCKERKEHSS